MHGAGNDFVVLDLRTDAALARRLDDDPGPLCRALADRHAGAGCDQILTIDAPGAAGALAAYRIWNADGSPSAQCGNGARCVAAWLVRDGAPAAGFAIDSPVGRHAVRALADGGYEVDMGPVAFAHARIPVQGVREDAAHRCILDVDGREVAFGVASMGNPHAVIEVESVDQAPVGALGTALQGHRAFPDSVNVGFAQVMSRDRVRLRVFERGVGETLACGSGACAAVAVLARQGRVDDAVDVVLPGGTLRIHYDRVGGRIRMSGPAAFVYEGHWLA
ncbi:MAG TPA: diaminopimelate epimerase [Luteimonas sp.]|nr:diaminopimelate epimerase [Luteimonas sp.]